MPEQYYGHPFFHEIAATETDIHNRKNHDYSKGGDPLGNFKRVSAILALYPGLNLSDPVVVAAVYALKQWDAFLWGMAQNITHKVEGYHDRLQDVSIYAKLARCLLKDKESGEAVRTTVPEPTA